MHKENQKLSATPDSTSYAVTAAALKSSHIKSGNAFKYWQHHLKNDICCVCLTIRVHQLLIYPKELVTCENKGSTLEKKIFFEE